jgi:hypothetical protein
MAEEFGDEESAEAIRKIEWRMRSRWTEMTRFQGLCDRYDNLYYPNAITKGGADHWPEDPNAKIPGRAHISLNTFPVYVDIPASLQSVEPIEDIVPVEDTEDSRTLAQGVERLYFAWKRDVDYERKAHQACIVKGLYGRTAAKIWWDKEAKRPALRIIDQPRNLWMGWGSTDYTRLDWAAYVYKVSESAATEEFGVETRQRDDGVGTPFTYVVPQRNLTYSPTPISSMRGWLHDADWGMIEVIDFWYRCPKEGAEITIGEPTEMETRNIIVVGNCVVKDECHEEYDGELPYVPLFNTFVPGIPDGRSELYDIEQLIREKEERLSAGGTLIQKTVGAQFWQLVGPESPDHTPVGLRPKPNEVVSPGAGNRIESIEPWMPEFQLEQYLTRLDREMVDVTGLNDLLRGLAPASVMSSSKAINALVANYEARIRMRRDLFYEWRQRVWTLASLLWVNDNPALGPIMKQAGRLQIINPSLTPRDDIETATMAANLLNARIWSQERAMAMTDVEDPEAEQQRIRENRTDASLFPADVQTIAATIATLQQLQTTQQEVAAQAMGAAGDPNAGMLPPEAMNGDQLQQGYAQQAGPAGMPMLNGEGEGAMPPPEAMPANSGQPGFGGQMTGMGGGPAQLQSMFSEGGVKNRVLTQQPLGGPGPGNLPPQGP